MNERIKELWNKAVYYNEDTQCWELDRKKFVDSIVSECCDLVKDDDNAFDILKHFGVEE